MTDRDHRRPRSEPEIIPPERPQAPSAIFIRVHGEDGTQRVYLSRPGPLTIVLALAVVGLIGLVMLIVLLSVAVIWIPVLIVLILAFILSMTLRRYWWRLRTWLGR